MSSQDDITRIVWNIEMPPNTSVSIDTKPIWRTAAAHKEDDFDAIWLYENAREWTFSEENGIVTLHYLSSKVMPERKGANKVSQEKQFCRNCGKRDSVFSQEDTVHFWEPGLCMECHQLPVIGIRYDVLTGKRIEPKPIHCRICGQETAQNVNGVCKTCWEAGAHLKADLEQEKSPTKLDHQRGKMRVLSDDISYLIMRIEHGSLASIAEHTSVQEEIHDLQHILADWDSYIGMEIARKAAQHAVNGWVSQISLRVGRRQE